MSMKEDAWQSFDKTREATDQAQLYYRQQAMCRQYAINEILEKHEVSSALDIACGEGASTEQLLEAAQHIDAVDLSQALIAKAKAKPSLDKVNFFCDDFLDFNCQSSYQLITASWFHNQLHSDDAQIAAKQKILGLLEDEGYCVFLVPSVTVSHARNLDFLRSQLNCEIGILDECSKYSRWVFSLDGKNWSTLTQWNPLYLYDIYSQDFEMKFIETRKICCENDFSVDKYLPPLFDILVGKKKSA
ncbi:class I SAM-dependent DNA methyltransferase [Piscirickettsia litoralis]|uniref:Methyltransferase domain-containing protein n=1 Tax=Piscirickettsia litoralis TaxID=1891921 RepID=A0ABX2ZZ43_9GAMM|nr:class I SAM-dependent methyltransferase [Piscirickettsia litoralis]ODN41837.1 hypothetical protein BGC07_01155 [Piscirickettsia litoralis]